jgi:hypothetical protein|uniref:3-methyladenine DNA glycosylase n=1 Tax=Cephaloticoccus sp. TaxID=1985742 RepID=UPI00404B40F0
MCALATALIFLPEQAWLARQQDHEARVRLWTDPQQARASRGEQHPVYDFLFEYYSFRAAWLRRWHPGPDVVLTGDRAREFLRWSEYQETADGVILSAALPEHRQKFVAWLRELLVTTAERPAFFGCFGLHEWAMVYRQTPEEVRHTSHPMRFSPDELARIVEASPLRCTHFDAFRFFTAPAAPLNKVQLTRPAMLQNEQRGCLHANMDLYKWAFKLAPFTPSELIADCFALARDIREIDMRASPYDLRALGFAPIPVETETGRAEYEQHQRAFAKRGQPLRERLRKLCERLLL